VLVDWPDLLLRLDVIDSVYKQEGQAVEFWNRRKGASSPAEEGRSAE
jgi:hypothetical protein